MINNPDAIEADRDAQHRPPQVMSGTQENLNDMRIQSDEFGRAKEDEDAQFRPP
jgi:hypothetical protein